ncbi:MAG: SPW repeat protein [Acidobacteriota bacterium]
MTDISDTSAWPRWINILAGAWLFISAFVWPHTLSAQANTWIVGALMFIVAIAALFQPPVRWANTALAVWLFVSTWFFPHADTATLWNNLIVAIVVFILSLTPSGAMTTSGRRPIGAT